MHGYGRRSAAVPQGRTRAALCGRLLADYGLPPLIVAGALPLESSIACVEVRTIGIDPSWSPEFGRASVERLDRLLLLTMQAGERHAGSHAFVHFTRLMKGRYVLGVPVQH